MYVQTKFLNITNDWGELGAMAGDAYVWPQLASDVWEQLDEPNCRSEESWTEEDGWAEGGDVDIEKCLMGRLVKLDEVGGACWKNEWRPPTRGEEDRS